MIFESKIWIFFSFKRWNILTFDLLISLFSKKSVSKFQKKIFISTIRLYNKMIDCVYSE